ncbi:hypothetical protein BXY58_1447 [Epilithonimonas arachidiradicis]|uniref:Uncharacterized protein n=1 Tax=Epilithonimonas arachidiradicis TaxID=1617282 RepID=A0A420DAR7_9FLAO|nr:hypothetical protein BXY58_1447 [Epilithonimonas arachidiradicis]
MGVLLANETALKVSADFYPDLRRIHKFYYSRYQFPSHIQNITMSIGLFFIFKIN